MRGFLQGFGALALFYGLMYAAFGAVIVLWQIAWKLNKHGYATLLIAAGGTAAGIGWLLYVTTGGKF